MAFVLPGLAARAAGAAVKGVGKVGSTVAHEAFRGAETLAKEGLAHAGTLAKDALAAKGVASMATLGANAAEHLREGTHPSEHGEVGLVPAPPPTAAVTTTTGPGPEESVISGGAIEDMVNKMYPELKRCMCESLAKMFVDGSPELTHTVIETLENTLRTDPDLRAYIQQRVRVIANSILEEQETRDIIVQSLTSECDYESDEEPAPAMEPPPPAWVNRMGLAPAPAPYPGQAPAPYPGQAPAPYPGQAPAPYPGQAPAPYPGREMPLAGGRRRRRKPRTLKAGSRRQARKSVKIVRSK
jgi:hypothetical protein